MNIHSRYLEISKHRKYFDVFTNKIYYPISSFLCALISRTSISPNQITILSIVFELSAITLILTNFLKYKYWIIFLLQLGWIFDLMDGMLARYKKMGFFSQNNPSIKGYYLDAVSDHVLKILVIGALTFQLSKQHEFGIYLGLIFIVIHSITQLEYSMRNYILLSTNRVKKKQDPKEYNLITQFVLISNNIYLFYLIFIPINRIDLLFITFGICELLIFIKRIFHFWQSEN